MRGFFHLVIFTLSIACFSACQEDAGTLTLPDDLDKDYSLVFTDTTHLVTSTILLDSLPTANSGMLLIGKYQDNLLGTVESKPFMQFGLGVTAWQPSTKATFESLELIFKYSGYYYGDTTVSQDFSVHKMTENFRTDSISQFWLEEFKYPSYDFLQSFLFLYPNLYNTSSFDTESSPIGTFSLTPPTPLKKEGSETSRDHVTITVPLDNNLGEQWLEEAKNPMGAFTSLSKFQKFFKGIMLKSNSNGSIVGIQTDSSGVSVVKVRLHYVEGGNSLYRDFRMIENVNNFNNITADRVSTPLEDLTVSNAEVPSGETDNVTYIQAGVGIFTKIKFPSLKKILDLPGFLKLNSAKLVIEPIEDSYDSKTYLPSSLILFETDNRNLPFQPLLADYNPRSYQTAPLQVNSIDNEVIGYTFSVTQYVQNLLTRETDTRNVGLLLSTPVDQMNRTVTRIGIGDFNAGENRIRLEIYYLRRNE